jgi:hypothetical protein
MLCSVLSHITIHDIQMHSDPHIEVPPSHNRYTPNASLYAY